MKNTIQRDSNTPPLSVSRFQQTLAHISRMIRKKTAVVLGRLQHLQEADVLSIWEQRTHFPHRSRYEWYGMTENIEVFTVPLDTAEIQLLRDTVRSGTIHFGRCTSFLLAVLELENTFSTQRGVDVAIRNESGDVAMRIFFAKELLREIMAGNYTLMTFTCHFHDLVNLLEFILRNIEDARECIDSSSMSAPDKTFARMNLRIERESVDYVLRMLHTLKQENIASQV